MLTSHTYGDRKLIVLLVLDGATNLLSGFPQQDNQAVTTMECMREWMDNHNCKPKNVVGDMAFMGGSFMAFYGQHGINPYPTGARTPWPNRAESAVRLFKAAFRVLSKAVQEEAILAKATFRQVVRVCCWARNAQLTKSGFCPLELATGRHPPDLLDVENTGIFSFAVYLHPINKINIDIHESISN